ncbi:MAG: hypothetical protein WBW46_12080 [Candidatus Sulfotelmatobacter sp.]
MILVGIYGGAAEVEMTGCVETTREIHRDLMRGDLTTGEAGLKYRKFPANPSLRAFDEGGASGFMTSKPFSHPPNSGKQPCKHPRVQIVSREEDAEFVECLECREVFESSELKDMSIEENTEGEAQES